MMVKYRIKSKKEIEDFLKAESRKRTTDFYFPEEMFFFCDKILTVKFSSVYYGFYGKEVVFHFEECGWNFIERWVAPLRKNS